MKFMMIFSWNMTILDTFREVVTRIPNAHFKNKEMQHQTAIITTTPIPLHQ
jgi:hypothetical protein